MRPSNAIRLQNGLWDNTHAKIVEIHYKAGKYLRVDYRLGRMERGEFVPDATLEPASWAEQNPDPFFAQNGNIKYGKLKQRVQKEAEAARNSHPSNRGRGGGPVS